MSFFKSIITKVVLPVLILAFFISCITQAPPIPAQKPPTQRPVTQRPPPPPKPPAYYDNLRNNDRDRDRVLSRARDKSKRDTSPECEGDDDCEDICSDIYRSRNDRNKCEEYSVTQVESLEGVHEAFEDPDVDDLEELDLSDVDLYLNISIEPLHKLIQKYRERESEDFLTWVAQNDEVAKILEKEDRDYEVIDRLFDSIHASGFFDALEENIDGRDTFMDLAVEYGNEYALEWVYEYIDDQDTNCSADGDPAEENCFTSWCSLGKVMKPDNARDLLDYDFFDGYIGYVLRDGINADPGPTVTNDTGTDCNILSDKGWTTKESVERTNSDSSTKTINCSKYFYRVGDLDQWWTDLCD